MTAVRVKDALDAIGNLVVNLVLAVRVASSVTLIAAVLVLGGALAAGHRHRVYDAVILKTLGATRRQLITAYALEYLLLGLATVLFGVAAGSLAALARGRRYHDAAVRLAGRTRGCGGARRARRHAPVRPRRHVCGAWSQAGRGAAKSLADSEFCRARRATLPQAFAAFCHHSNDLSNILALSAPRLPA